ncbi:hypothetical protein RISK_002357 [Rhodopirellula islandica]|uniref:Uncharacterized protein n=1 Tax=Rhodopirellula islandica TaxID=595434 RepID=A0A0J1BGQ9_RHOIS|nr:hypothetical protein RISK_002357 [Rhodopirellula islandica]
MWPSAGALSPTLDKSAAAHLNNRMKVLLARMVLEFRGR